MCGACGDVALKRHYILHFLARLRINTSPRLIHLHFEGFKIFDNLFELNYEKLNFRTHSAETVVIVFRRGGFTSLRIVTLFEEQLHGLSLER